MLDFSNYLLFLSNLSYLLLNALGKCFITLVTLEWHSCHLFTNNALIWFFNKKSTMSSEQT